MCFCCSKMLKIHLFSQTETQNGSANTFCPCSSRPCRSAPSSINEACRLLHLLEVTNWYFRENTNSFPSSKHPGKAGVNNVTVAPAALSSLRFSWSQSSLGDKHERAVCFLLIPQSDITDFWEVKIRKSSFNIRYDQLRILINTYITIYSHIHLVAMRSLLFHRLISQIINETQPAFPQSLLPFGFPTYK